MNLENSKPPAPNFREVQACNNCKNSYDQGGGDTPGGAYVGCTKYEEVDSVYNQYVCDDYKKIWEEE